MKACLRCDIDDALAIPVPGYWTSHAKLSVRHGRSMTTTIPQTRAHHARHALSRPTLSLIRRNLRMASGLILFTYIGAHLINHALGLISLDMAEEGMGIATEVWYSMTGTVLLYGAAMTHFVLALWAVYERRTFRLPIWELVRIALGFSLPIILIGHAANTRLAYDVYGLNSDYTRVVSDLVASGSQGWQLGLMAPGWIHGCLGLNFAFRRRPLFQKMRLVLFAAALLLPVFSGLGFLAMGKALRLNASAAAAAQEYLTPAHAKERKGIEQWRNRLITGYFIIIGAVFAARTARNALERGRKRLVTISYPGRNARVPRGWSVLEASRSFYLPARRHVRRSSALFDLPGARHIGRGVLPASRRGRTGDAQSYRRGARRAPCLSIAPARRHFSRPAGAHREADLPAGGAATRCRARNRRAVLRFSQLGRAGERSDRAGPALRVEALHRGHRQRHPLGRRHGQLHRARQHLCSVRPRTRACASGPAGLASGQVRSRA